MVEKTPLENILEQGLTNMAENMKGAKGKTQIDKITAKVQNDIDIFKNLNGGKALPLIARDEIGNSGVKAIYLFTLADSNVYLRYDGNLVEASRSKDNIVERSTKEIVLKYGPKLCHNSLMDAAKRFNKIESEIAFYGNEATIVSGVHAAARP